MKPAADSELLVLALETSCDESAVAILRGTEVLATEIASQVAEHKPYGGVVPELASRNHLVHTPKLIESAVHASGIALRGVDGFAATSGPGLASSLMIGASLAKGLALGFGKPYLAVNHLEGHLLSPFFGEGNSGFVRKNISLIASGGHTMLVEVRGVGDYELLGRTRDDAAGEAFDKVAKLLELPYPGGPEIENRARNGDPARFEFPRSMLHSGDHDFSFSGLKTAVRYLLPKLQGTFVDDVCAAFQEAMVDVLIGKTIAAAREREVSLVTMSGGVSCNGFLRSRLTEACKVAGLELLLAEPRLCTDNAAMIGFVAALRLAAGDETPCSAEIDPNLVLA